jgi:hypothetical protein
MNASVSIFFVNIASHQVAVFYFWTHSSERANWAGEVRLNVLLSSELRKATHEGLMVVFLVFW